MRARNVKPGFFDNETLANLGPYAMLLFEGLWTIADREGRLEDRPQRIKAKIFPYFPKQNVDALLKKLDEAGFINRYTVEQEQFISIPKWKKHQNPHVKEVPSTIPAPCKNSTGSGNSGASRADSGFLIPSSLIPDSSNPQSGSDPVLEELKPNGKLKQLDVSDQSEKTEIVGKCRNLWAAGGQKWDFSDEQAIPVFQSRPIEICRNKLSYAEYEFRKGNWRTPAKTMRFVNFATTDRGDSGPPVRTLERDLEPARKSKRQELIDRV